MNMIIKNPSDNLYSIYSKSKNKFLLEKASEEEVIQYYIDEAKTEAEQILNSVNNKNPYGVFEISYAEACEFIENGVPGVGFC